MTTNKSIKKSIEEIEAELLRNKNELDTKK